MVTSQFGAILKDLEPLFHCTLEPDENNACVVQLKSGVKVQIELDRHGDLLVGVKLGAIPSSRYLEKVLQEALKANHLHFPLTSGILGYSKKTNQLILFMVIDSRSISPDRLTTSLVPFLAKAQVWSEAISLGNVPVVEEETKQTITKGLFGIAH